MALALPLALDAMGGDHAPASVLEGAAIALTRHPGLRFVVYGQPNAVLPILAHLPAVQAASHFVPCDTVVGNDDKPSAAVRQGRQSSMRKAIDAVAEGEAFGVVSAGNTGALMAMSKIVLKTLPGISRPAIAALFPTLKGECVMLDLGANVECSATDLLNFAVMGEAFARAVLGLKRPKIGLLNIGSEELKGHDEIKEAHALLRESGLDLDYYGFVEGNEVPAGVVDVVVTDGFTGNIALKTAEGTARLFKAYIRDALHATLLSRLGALCARGALQAVKDRLDERKRNGAMFLGLAGIAIKSHGAADAYSFANAITVAVELAEGDVNATIIAELKTYDETHPASAADPFE